jgi:hypothetical protein
MKAEGKKGVIAVNAFLFAALFGLISLNKEYIRPAIRHSDFLVTLTGCFPNFIAAYIISLWSVSAVLIRKIKHGRIIVYTASLFVFAMLTLEELKPMWGASTQYDPFDIVASGAGAALAILTYEIILLKRNNKRKNEMA